MLIIRVPHDGLFDASIKTFETTEYSQMEFFYIDNQSTTC